ncbi:MAG: TRAP transporter substrate-binding protein DctP [Myxococcota bacterium]|jgi:TRAP-type C4-dicarboxylate transport system substrate-binding protein
MNRIRAFKLALLVTAVSLALVFPASGQEPFVVKIATISPEGTAITKALKTAGDEIKARTGGRVSFRIYPGGVMGSDSVVMRKMRTGQIHASSFTAGGMSAAYPNYQIMSLPLLFLDYREVDAVRAKIEPLLTKGCEEKGYVSLGIVETGFVYIMSNKPIGGPDDLRGRKVWIPEGDPIGRAVFEAAHVPPVPLPLPDVLTGLQTGLLDTVSSSPIGTLVLQWFTKVKYLTESPLLYSYGTFAFSKEAWEKIPVADRPIVREITIREIRKLDAQNRLDNDAAMETLKKQGLKFIPMSPGAMPKLQQIADTAISNLMKQGQFDAGMLQEIRSTVKTVRSPK